MRGCGVLRGLGVVVLLLLLGASPPGAAKSQSLTALEAPAGSITSAPIGWTQFCEDYKGECGHEERPAQPIDLTAETWSVLQSTNNLVNRTIEPVDDVAHWNMNEKWDYPSDGKGDCEDYALAKRKVLLDRGYPLSALLLTVVYRQGDREGHAVLMIKTKGGDLILDNRRDVILDWSDTGYTFLKRQSQENANRWVTLGPGASIPAAVWAKSNPSPKVGLD